jgi:hypothetical protein
MSEECCFLICDFQIKAIGWQPCLRMCCLTLSGSLAVRDWHPSYQQMNNSAHKSQKISTRKWTPLTEAGRNMCADFFTAALGVEPGLEQTWKLLRLTHLLN